MLYNVQHGRVDQRARAASGCWGYGRAVLGSVLGAVTGLMTALLAGVFVATLLVWSGQSASGQPASGQPANAVEILLLSLPPLGAVAGCAWALRAGRLTGAFLSAGILTALAPLAPLALWRAGTLLGTDNLWSLRIVPVLVLVLSTLLARALSLILLRSLAPGPRRDAGAQGHTL